MKQTQSSTLFKNIHQLTSSLAQNRPMNIILTTNNQANTGDGEEADESLDDEQQENDS